MFIPYSAQSRKLLFSLISCYAKDYYGSNDAFNMAKAQDELKKLWTESTGINVEKLKPFDNMENKLIATGIKKEDVEKVMGVIVREAQKLVLSLNGSVSLKTTIFSQENANNFISFLIGFLLENNINIPNTILQTLDEDQNKQRIYACIINNKCVICGRYTNTLHHIDRVGTTGYKNDTGVGKRMVSLCQYHHGEVESIGEENMKLKYPLYEGLKLTENDVMKIREVYPKHYFQGIKED